MSYHGKVLESLTKAKNEVPLGKRKNIGAYGGVNGAIKEIDNYEVTLDNKGISLDNKGSSPVVSSVALSVGPPAKRQRVASPPTQASSPKPAFSFAPPAAQQNSGNLTLSWDQAFAHAKTIDSLYVAAQHTNVWTNETWRTIYCVNKGLRTRLRSDGNEEVGGETYLVPCHNCGYVYDWEAIQVDHYMPQAGGSGPQIMKMLRALGLTKEGPVGSKGQNIGKIHDKSLRIYPKDRVPGNYGHFGGDYDHLDRWNTNPEGVAFLSALAFGGTFTARTITINHGSDIKVIKYWETLEIICKNSLLNLVPLCGTCNGAKGNKVHKGIDVAK